MYHMVHSRASGRGGLVRRARLRYNGAMAMDDQTTSARLRDLLPELSAQMAQAARYVLAHPEDVAVFSMRELAKRADVPPVTMVRLAQRLGLKGYDALRRRYIDGVRVRSASNIVRAREVASAARDRDAMGFAASFFAAEHEILDRTLAGLSDEKLAAAAERLVSARRIVIMARRTPYPVAFAMAYALRKVKPDTVLPDDHSGFGAESPEIGAGDALVAITFAPYSRITLAMAESAAKAGAALIVITDNARAPIARHAKHLFVTSTRGQAFPESVTGALAIGNLLVSLVVARLGDVAIERIRENEARIVASGEYVLVRRGRKG